MRDESEFDQKTYLLGEVAKLKSELKKRMEEREKTSENLLAHMRLASIGRLAAGVAHELNNPLSVILGFSQSLSRRFGENDDLRDPLKTIEREAERCKRVILDLLNFARVPKPGKAREDAAQMLESVLTLVEAKARISHVELIRDFAEGVPPIYANRHQIQQMIMNLCDNAFDAMPRGGKLTIRISLAAGSKENPVIEIRVTDTGTGIAPEIRERIFEPFFTTKENEKGTGLGLSLVSDIARDHEADIQVDSHLGHGTTICVRFLADKCIPPSSQHAGGHNRAKNVPT